jgi:TolB-like protein/predicted Ser/Thr protein kinase
MVAETVSHFRVLERLGGGAMGVVYLAEDLQLGRRVALKLLPPELTRDDSAKARFIVEARTASSLDHPNICPVHEVGETADGHVFLAMAYCEGETLRARLEGGPLRIADALDIAAQVAEGLSEAHAHGIVHRDIKPANLMVAKSGRVRIVDFGVAKLVGHATLTVPGLIVGTVAYMAPEQARGEAVDGRTDLWALGVVLYEMLTGRRPFAGESAEAVIYAILNREPEPIDRLRTDVPASAGRAIRRALAKDPRARYQQAEQMLADLHASRQGLASSGISAGAAGRQKEPSIAVLPLFDMSPSKDQEYFCDGMAEELINALGRVAGLRVASLTSALQFKGRAQDIRRIGEELGVETVLEGSVRKAGNRLRVTAQLVNVSDGYHLWAERYDRDLDDVFAVQDDIARAVVEKLQVKLVGRAETPLVKRLTESPEAYRLYLQGRYYFSRRYKGQLDKAMQSFAEAIQVDPLFAAAYAGLADSYSVMGFYGFLPASEVHTRAREAAERALALDDSLAEAHHAIGQAKVFLDWDWPGIKREFARALDLNPGLAVTHAYFSLPSAITDETDLSRREAQRAAELDPLSALTTFLCAASHYLRRDYDRALAECERMLELDPDFVPGLWLSSLVLSPFGRHEESINAAGRATTLSRNQAFFASALGQSLAAAGRGDEARQILSQLVERSRHEYVLPACIIGVHAALGDIETTLELLERAAVDRCPSYPLLLAGPGYDSIRAHPRFAGILTAFNYHERALLKPPSAA